MKEFFTRLWCSRLLWIVCAGINFSNVVISGGTAIFSIIALLCCIWLVFSPPTCLPFAKSKE